MPSAIKRSEGEKMIEYLREDARVFNGTWLKEERLSEKSHRVGIAGLSDKELVKLALRNKPSLFSDSIADDVLSILNGNTDDIYSNLKAVGIEESIALSLVATLELSRRRTTHKGKSLTTPNDIFQTIRHYAFDNYQEKLVVIAFNGAQEVIFNKVVTQGLLDRTVVHPREVFAEAIKRRASAIIIAHNHPSGCLEPSEADRDITQRLVLAGNILGVKLLDHLIFTEDGFYSFREHDEI